MDMETSHALFEMAEADKPRRSDRALGDDKPAVPCRGHGDEDGAGDGFDAADAWLVAHGESPFGDDPAVSGVGCGDLGGAAAVQSDPDLAGMDLWELADAGGFGDDWEGHSLPVVDDEDDLSLPLGTDPQSIFAAQKDFSKPRRVRRRKRIGIYIPTFSEDDFEEGPPREAFALLRDNVRACYLSDVAEGERQTALNWVFEQDAEAPFSFDLCCRVLEAEPQIIRARLQYEFFLRWRVLKRPFSMLAAPLPEHLTSMAWYAAGDHGVRVAAVIWSWPGVDTRHLFARINEGVPMDRALFMQTHERLDAIGVIQSNTDSWYTTGRGHRED